MKFSKSNFLYAILFVAIFLSRIFEHGIGKYIILGFASIFFIIISIKNKRIVDNRFFIKTMLVPLFCIGYSLFIAIFNGLEHGMYMIKYFIFLLYPVVIGYLFSYSLIDKRKMINITFISLLLYTFIEDSQVLLNMILNRNFKFLMLDTHFSVLESYSSHVFGLYFIYFLINKEKKSYVLVSLLLMIIGNKRIVVAAALLSVFLYYFLKRIKTHKKLYILIIITCLVISQLIFVYLIYSNKLDIIMSHYNINGMGRMSIYRNLDGYYNFSLAYTGRGLGFSMYVLDQHEYFTNNLHSDILLYYIELGFMGLIIYNILLYNLTYYISKRYKNITLLSFILITFTMLINYFDFISININYTVILYSILFSEVNDNRRKIITSNL
ncbi:hypothetical protein [Clostridium sp. BSD9I1]|uniref:hypothetical protein n=1 Tax=Clostridium sp. BSD9I1 TaxID=2003589 RepID=UPI001647F9FC|nr:hypothetical protein [Clostridium sp. BSD9I1]